MALSYGLNTTRFRSYAELKATYPSLPDGVYSLFPNGRSGPMVRTYCMTHDGEHYQLIWKQFGGTRYATFGDNVADSELIANRGSYNTVVQPFSVSNTMGSHITANGYDFWKDQTDVTWLKSAKGYTSAGTFIADDSTYTFNAKLVYDSRVCMADTWRNSTQAELLPGYVNMYIGNTSYGRTRYIQGWPVDFNIGFANAENGDNQGVPDGEDLMTGWSARHILSYVHTSNGRDATRCQFRCWDGTEDVAQEILWFVKYNYE